MSAARIIRALLNVTTAAHRAFANSEPAGDASHARVINDADYSGLTRELRALDVIVARKGRSESGPLLAERALSDTLQKLERAQLAGDLAAMRDDQAARASQVAPASALPSRPDYWNIDTAGAQYATLACGDAVGNLMPREGGGLVWVGAGGALPEGNRGGIGGNGGGGFFGASSVQGNGNGIVRVNVGGAGGGPDVIGFVGGQRVEFDVAPAPAASASSDATELTPERVERFLGAADDELGPECCDAWVEKCRAILRAAAAKGGDDGR